MMSRPKPVSQDQQSTFAWADGSTRKWNSGEPNYNGASCGYIWKTSGRWDDVACSINKYAIIEFD